MPEKVFVTGLNLSQAGSALPLIFVNGKIAYSGDYRQDIGRIVGAKIRFTGTGVVREFELRGGK